MDILFEDKELLLVNKPAGLLVENSGTNENNSLTNLLAQERKEVLFPCHRLDRDTSGVIIFAKKMHMLKQISGLFASHVIRKTYLACVDGEWNPTWNRVETHIRRMQDGRMANSREGKISRTTFRRLAYWNDSSLLEVLPKTGRTHQIRLHCLFHGCPIKGDILYGTSDPQGTPMALHARELRFQHPLTRENLTITAPLPDYWQKYWLLGCPVEIR